MFRQNTILTLFAPERVRRNPRRTTLSGHGTPDACHYPETETRHYYTHQWSEYIEDTAGKIGERTHPKHGRLRESARVPGNQHRCDRNRVLHRTAEQTRLKSVATVERTVHIARNYQCEILVGSGAVHRKSARYGSADYARALAQTGGESVSKLCEHASPDSHRAENHRRQYKEHGREHAEDSTGLHEAVKFSTSGWQSRTTPGQ